MKYLKRKKRTVENDSEKRKGKPMNILIELPDTIDAGNCSFILRDIAKQMQWEKGLFAEQMELMDGSYAVKTDYGTAFVKPNYEISD